MSIYVEILVRAPMEVLWAHTQTPELHERWDLRFSTIDSIPPKADEPGVQRFRYMTRFGLGVAIGGDGETVTHRELPDGGCSSSLRFASSHPLSMIREGSGYWKYVPTRQGIRFLTWYDYRTRFGAAGLLVDRVVFRPAIGWATAWSFDRLRLWLEDGIEPSVALRQAVLHAVTRIALVVIFAYQGYVEVALAAALTPTTAIAPSNVPSAWRCLRKPPSRS